MMASYGEGLLMRLSAGADDQVPGQNISIWVGTYSSGRDKKGYGSNVLRYDWLRRAEGLLYIALQGGTER